MDGGRRWDGCCYGCCGCCGCCGGSIKIERVGEQRGAERLPGSERMAAVDFGAETGGDRRHGVRDRLIGEKRWFYLCAGWGHRGTPEKAGPRELAGAGDGLTGRWEQRAACGGVQ